MSKESRGDRIVVRFDGIFDAADEWELHGILAAAPFDCRVTADLRQVRHFHDIAVGMLARDMEEAPGRISLLGLRQHQQRILRLFGIDVRGAEPPSDPCK